MHVHSPEKFVNICDPFFLKHTVYTIVTPHIIIGHIAETGTVHLIAWVPGYNDLEFTYTII
jgi:hypothetical protein